MVKNYTKEQFRKIFENLPQELQETIFSEETANSIESICEKNDYNNSPEIARYTGRVLMGLILPEEFENLLEKELKIKKVTAKEIAREINRFIFYPVKELLSSINSTETKEQGTKKTIKKIEEIERKEKKLSSGSDSYREMIEE